MKTVVRKITAIAFAFAVIAGTIGASTEAQANTEVAKPTVVVIRAEWCGACQKVEPIMKGLIKEYGSKMNFVILDVTDEAAEAKSYAKAKSLGLGNFFKANKKKTSTVAIFIGHSKVFQTIKNYNRSAYVNAFNKALR